MRMGGLFFGGLFWGVLISLFGLSMVFKYAFNINLPLVRIFFGIVIILFGIKLIIGFSSKHNSKSFYKINQFRDSKEFNVLFSDGVLDLTSFPDVSKMPKEISVIFGNATVIVPDIINFEIKSTTVFGSTIIPKRSFGGFGEDVYVINNAEDAPIYTLTTNTFFGRLEFKIKTTNSNREEHKDKSSEANTDIISY